MLNKEAIDQMEWVKKMETHKTRFAAYMCLTAKLDALLVSWK